MRRQLGAGVSPSKSGRQESARARRRPRRDRHGRGLRGPLSLHPLPIMRTRAERFDDLVLDAVEDVERRWARQLAGVEFVVEDVPPPDAVETWAEDPVPLARLLPRRGSSPARIVVYRRPLEARAVNRADLSDLVHEVVVEQVAEYLGLDPETVDPRYGEGDY
ncbi:metallopeptidase family protein [Carbonactinospora thermoautotrophica]|uniref:Peptidase n=2 Tax=Carbonactinospora thermoautotrophica TaxID=1469144 RepID=A0A132MWX6_9ACTN|nr:metallopeptidase family protein [Carbonactinospora thermoautotrophica]KWX02343.1 Uncharacterized protein LI90_3386 [Carbonactinospora thermoautotrophica]